MTASGKCTNKNYIEIERRIPHKARSIQPTGCTIIFEGVNDSCNGRHNQIVPSQRSEVAPIIQLIICKSRVKDSQ